ncbi:MAG: molybdate ABC transporter substrate-binding protein [Anaerolineae bacterium]|nr:molybdate ABC transporter substrate-binding protein [Anaerolineae bacterium]
MSKMTRMKWFWPLALLFLSACTQREPHTLTVFAASSLTDAFGEISAEFEAAHPETRIVLNFAGSQALRSQIAFGAEADVFAAADFKQMDALVDAGLVSAEAVTPFLTNQLVLITPPDNPANITVLSDLAGEGVTIVMAAPDVPAGAYTLATLNALATDPSQPQAVLANVVSEELNVRQVLAKVALGEADAGFVYASDVVAAGAGAVNIISLPVPSELRPAYPIAVLDNASSAESAAEFVAFVLSEAGQTILRKWGFDEPPRASAP